MKHEIIDLNFEVNETENIVNDVSTIINQSRKVAYKAIDIVLLKRNWLIGKRINDEELKETRTENYGLEIIKNLSKILTERFGNGFGKQTLYNFYKFYKTYKNIFQTVFGQSFLSWSHYLLLMAIEDTEAREWYEKKLLNYLGV